ncbi:hypothetical protein [Meiothermus granaticius]|uniref:Uncharacterized protein n=1 Tax=Meiothermus granaticius NBRC 107808 TaxID=1227551 RepID=A0A399F7M8_9DEIN|nr:hypothetical protein [Meiothermus granaticius]RIH91735.1 hypothetical protein Mgrana_02401 [Meiothermus granaticius NBRC 107808]
MQGFIARDDPEKIRRFKRLYNHIYKRPQPLVTMRVLAIDDAPERYPLLVAYYTRRGSLPG